ncbi:PPOX2, partial [Symbiodinium pilosum]
PLLSMSCGYASAGAEPDCQEQQEVPAQPSNSALPGSVSTVLWVLALKAALNHGGTRRPKRWRREAKRKQLQLATVDPETMAPSVRTVVFQGFLRSDHLVPAAAAAPAEGSDSEESLAGAPSPQDTRDSCIIILVTDSRAQKVRHAQASFPKTPVEICWWLDEAAVQFRISGRALVADPRFPRWV